MNEKVSCKNCRAYRPTTDVEAELSGRFETETMPYGWCIFMDDKVREDEWCGQFTEKKKDGEILCDSGGNY